ncbi:MAG TPA: GNAT family N-acetyltransferase [Phenylobacterium sp.]
MSLGPTLTTPRLILRPPRAEDFEPWAAFVGDAEAAQFLGGAQPPSAAWRIMCTFTGAWTVEGFSNFSVIERDTGRWVGRLGPWRPHGWPGDEVGWGIVRDCWGLGYATEGASAAIDWVFDELGWTEVIHCIDPANFNSQGVATRLGSRVLRQAELPAPVTATVDVWGQTRDEWRARKG